MEINHFLKFPFVQYCSILDIIAWIKQFGIKIHVSVSLLLTRENSKDAYFRDVTNVRIHIRIREYSHAFLTFAFANIWNINIRRREYVEYQHSHMRMLIIDCVAYVRIFSKNTGEKI